MINYLYDKDPLVLQGRAQRMDESGGGTLHVGRDVEEILTVREL